MALGACTHHKDHAELEKLEYYQEFEYHVNKSIITIRIKIILNNFTYSTTYNTNKSSKSRSTIG